MAKSARNAAMTTIDKFTRRTHVAYFSMEIALRSEIHTYSGGLGVLAGDTARSCADLELPVVFVSLVSSRGYLRQEIDLEGRQVEHPDPWQPSQWATPQAAKIAVPIEGRDVWIRPWLYVLSTAMNYDVPIILLDTDLEENFPPDREITADLYGRDVSYRLKQEIVLGVGGRRMLTALGFEPHAYHLNEGHAAFLALDLLRGYRREEASVVPGECIYDISLVRERCIFTTHTPVESGIDRFPYDLVERHLDGFMETSELKLIGGADELNMTRVALNLSGYVNGVAEQHAQTTNRIFPGYHVRAITNGVHAATWTARAFKRIYDAHFPNWAHEPEILVRADQISDDEIWKAHAESKSALLNAVRDIAGKDMADDAPLIGFARRMTGYKRLDLIFSDIERLLSVHRQFPFHVVIAGKAHPRDTEGKRIIEAIHGHIRRLTGKMHVAFLPNYDMELAKIMVAGVDVWLNTPLPPLEASGTSGMKAAFNGVLNLSVLDGWWLEACIEDVTGWAIGDNNGPATAGDDGEQLYDKLERTVLPLYYRDRGRWIWMMKQSISKVAYYFNSQRMMRRYASEAYLR